MNNILKGTWVEIVQVILRPEERASSLPEDTKKVPYTLRVSGFLMQDRSLGETALIRTIIGRELTGTLVTVNPSYSHSFGTTVPELLTIGTEYEQ
jgi:hypothetical protein